MGPRTFKRASFIFSVTIEEELLAISEDDVFIVRSDEPFCAFS
jgi:hypothetical protein